MAELPHVDDDRFEDELKEPGLVLVDFWATWCGPCRKLKPVLEELADTNAGKVKVIAVDIEEAPQAAERFDVTSVPTLILLQAGQVVHEVRGARTKAALLNELSPYLS